jgi:mannose-6-phosphate isomerase-like protein (cupin superfamily)
LSIVRRGLLQRIVTWMRGVPAASSKRNRYIRSYEGVKMFQPKNYRNEQGEQVLELMGATWVFKAMSEDTGGKFSVLEYTAPANFGGPQPHWHQQTTEAFHVIEGALEIHRGDEALHAGPGDFVLVPPRTLHTFSNNCPQPAKFLVILSPGGLEGYFFELAELMRGETSWPPADVTKITAIAREYDTFAPPVE